MCPVYFFIFETRGRTLEDVNELFDKNHALDTTVESERGTTPDTVSTEKETAVKRPEVIESGNGEKTA
jgi:hypothetical protein